MSKKTEWTQPGHPPEYANRIAIPPPSSLSDEERKGAPYRLGRLKETTILYHWALWWSIHHGYDWTLGTGPHPFTLGSCPLGLLPARQKLNNTQDAVADSPRWVETYEDAKETFGWNKADAISGRGNGFVWTVRPPVRLENGEMVSLPPSIAYPIDADEPGDHVQPPEEREPTETDEVMSVTFKMDDVDRLPWYQIVNALRRAQLDVRDLLEANGTHWTTPPFFHGCESGRELLDNIRDREWKPLAVLRELEEHRKEKVGVIRAALNPPEPAVLDSDEMAARIAQMLAREVAKENGTTQVLPNGPAVSTNAPKEPKRRWTEADADAAIRKYKTDNSAAYGNLARLVEAKRKGANEKAQAMFGRNAMADKLDIPRATVSNTEAWAETCSMFGWGKDTTAGRSAGTMQRETLEIADEKAGVQRGDVTAQNVERRERQETISIIKESIGEETKTDRDAVADLIGKLDRGEVDDEVARGAAKLAREQAIDRKTRVVHQKP